MHTHNLHRQLIHFSIQPVNKVPSCIGGLSSNGFSIRAHVEYVQHFLSGPEILASFAAFNFSLLSLLVSLLPSLLLSHRFFNFLG